MGTLADTQKARWPHKLKDKHYRFIDNAMAKNDQLTSSQLHQVLREAYPELEVCVSTVKRARRELGWIWKKTRYCALISETTTWCKERIKNGDLEFENVMWMAECLTAADLPSRRRAGSKPFENETNISTKDQCLGGDISKRSYLSHPFLRNHECKTHKHPCGRPDPFSELIVSRRSLFSTRQWSQTY